MPVDGGHRAIKYTRIGGVQKDIYNEGRALDEGDLSLTMLKLFRNSY